MLGTCRFVVPFEVFARSQRRLFRSRCLLGFQLVPKNLIRFSLKRVYYVLIHARDPRREVADDDAQNMALEATTDSSITVENPRRPRLQTDCS